MSDAYARTAEDKLREEYFRLLPQIQRAAEELEAEVRYLLIPITRQLEGHERIVVKSRIKECPSAIASLKRRPELWSVRDPVFSIQSLRSLNDLAGIRILAFPRQRLLEIDNVLRGRFSDWVSDPVPAAPGTSGSLAIKYHGYCSRHCSVRAEIQLMSMLVGLFWEVEHAALYKPGEHLKGIEKSLRMQERNADVIRALTAFETQFETLVNDQTDLEKREEAVTN
jgi:ppGpp synthetase/RelA/SpoT-type nucleotidyltranferase